MQLWYLADNINSGFSLKNTQTLPFDITSGGTFDIQNINGNNIVVNGMTMRRVHNLKRYFKLRNEITAMPLESGYEDSVRKILDMKTQTIALLPVPDDTKDKLVSTLHCDSFAKQYQGYLQSKLQLTKAEVSAKKDLYHKAVDGKVPLDSTTFNNFISNYNHSYYDQKLLYHFITNKPELFFLEINLFAVEQDVAFCSACFTKEELDEMYCKLKPFKSKDPRKLWMFERLREYKCPQD